MSIEDELIGLTHDVQYTNGDPNYAPLYEFFSKILQKNQTIKITPKIREIIPFLSSCDSGHLWSVAQRTIPGVKPSMLVPDLDIHTKPFVARRSQRVSLTPRPTSIPTSFQLPIHQLQKKTVRPIQVMTTRDILPALATSIPGQFYYCSPKKKIITESRDSALSYNVHRKRLPPIPINPDQKIFTLRGMLEISPKSRGNFVPMKQFLYSKEKLFLSSNIPFFYNWLQNKMFIRWFYRLRNKRYKRTQSAVLNSCPFGHTEFIDMYFEIRDTANTIFTQIHPISDDKESTDLFEGLVKNSNESIEEMKSNMKKLFVVLAEKITKFIQQVTGISQVLRADFNILKKINALPKPLIPYSIDDGHNDSLTSCQIRTKILHRERRRAFDRKEYLPRFFIMVRFFLRDFFVERLHSALREFYFRFIESPPTKSHQVQLFLDEKDGLLFSPSRTEFVNWFNIVDQAVKDIVICDQLTLDQEVMDQIFPDNDCPDVLIIKDVAVNQEMIEMRENALIAINDAYDYFEKKLKSSQILLIKMQSRLEEITNIEEYKDTEQYVNVVKETLDNITDIEQLSRILTYGSLFTDMKEGKVAAIDKVNKTLDKVKALGIARAKSFYEEIDNDRNEYTKSLSFIKTQGIDLETPAMISLKKTIKTKCESYIPLVQCIVTTWPTDVAVAEIHNFLFNVREILSLVTPKPRMKRVKKKKISKTEAETETE